MTETLADPVAAIAGLLKDNIGDLVGDRIYRPSLPKTEAFRKAMPRACIAVTSAGGGLRYGGSLQQLTDPRVQIKVFGATEQEADNIARQAASLLRQRVRVLSRGARIDSVNVTGPLSVVDPDTDWPYSLLSAQVLMIEQAVV
jgi:hypothetical protein